MDLSSFHLPRFKDLPDVPLYKEQVITYLENVMAPITIHTDEKLLTPTMLNNYVKQKIVSPPKDKKYTQKHLAYLIVVCCLKQLFSLNEVCDLIRVQIKHADVEHCYNCFCNEVEKAFYTAFHSRDFSYLNLEAPMTPESELLRSVVIAFAHKLYTQEQLKKTLH